MLSCNCNKATTHNSHAAQNTQHCFCNTPNSVCHATMATPTVLKSFEKPAKIWANEVAAYKCTTWKADTPPLKLE